MKIRKVQNFQYMKLQSLQNDIIKLGNSLESSSNMENLLKKGLEISILIARDF